MDLKTLIGKTLFFVMIVAFVAIFSAVFGSENSLIGVMMIVAALMLMGRDMSSHVGFSFFTLLLINLCIGIGAFIASEYVIIGVAINFALVFTITFIMRMDMKSTLEFPFLLGYILILSVPVDINGLPLRLLSLTVGTVFVVALNLIANKKRTGSITGHQGIISLTDLVIDAVDTRVAGGEATPESLSASSAGIRSGIFDRLRKGFYTTPENRSVMNLAVSLEQLGRVVCREDIDAKVLSDLREVLVAVRTCTEGGMSQNDLHSKIDGFLSGYSLPSDIVCSLRAMDYELGIITDGSGSKRPNRPKYATGKGDIPLEYKASVRLRESFRLDSMPFTYAFRLALLIAVFEFIGMYFDVLAARWLAFTSLAICLPYLDRDLAKAKMRITGAVAGILIFTAITLVVSDVTILMFLAVALNYLYTLFDPMRYDIKMMLINISALLVAATVLPQFTTGIEDAALRMACILGGTVIVIVCNRIILPYRIHTENIKLGKRALAVGERLLCRRLDGDDEMAAARDLLTADLISEKIRANVFQCPDGDLDMFLHHQSEAVIRCALYGNAVNSKLISEEEIDAGLASARAMHDKARDDLVRYVTKVASGYKPEKMPYREF
jgi:hypothetical protein